MITDGPVVAGIKRDLREVRRWSGAFQRARQGHAYEAENYRARYPRSGASNDADAIEPANIAEIVCTETERAPLSHMEWRALTGYHGMESDLTLTFECILGLLSDESRQEIETSGIASNVSRLRPATTQLLLALAEFEHWIMRFEPRERERVLYMFSGINHRDTLIESGVNEHDNPVCQEINSFRSSIPRPDRQSRGGAA